MITTSSELKSFFVGNCFNDYCGALWVEVSKDLRDLWQDRDHAKPLIIDGRRRVISFEQVDTRWKASLL